MWDSRGCVRPGAGGRLVPCRLQRTRSSPAEPAAAVRRAVHGAGGQGGHSAHDFPGCPVRGWGVSLCAPGVLTPPRTAPTLAAGSARRRLGSGAGLPGAAQLRSAGPGPSSPPPGTQPGPARGSRHQGGCSWATASVWAGECGGTAAPARQRFHRGLSRRLLSVGLRELPEERGCGRSAWGQEGGAGHRRLP